jgi:hypothetical protein
MQQVDPIIPFFKKGAHCVWRMLSIPIALEDRGEPLLSRVAHRCSKCCTDSEVRGEPEHASARCSGSSRSPVGRAVVNDKGGEAEFTEVTDDGSDTVDLVVRRDDREDRGTLSRSEWRIDAGDPVPLDRVLE